MHVYVGTSSRAGTNRLHCLCFDDATGRLEPRSVAGEVTNPSFLVRHPSGRFLYSTSEVTSLEGRETGGVAAFAVEPASGALRFLNGQPSMAPGPCHISIDRGGRHVLVANYRGASFAILPIGEDGALSPASDVVEHSGSSVHPKRQTRPYPHCCMVDPSNRWVFVADLGADRIVRYGFDQGRGRIERDEQRSFPVSEGSGPRHLTFHPNGRFAYVVNELNSTINAFKFEADTGLLTEIQSIPTVPLEYEGENSPAEIRVSPSGQYLYASNRGHDSIVGYGIDPAAGVLSTIGFWSTRGRKPRHFALTPDGRHLLVGNQDSAAVISFVVGAEGELAETGYSASLDDPVCILFNPVGSGP